MTTMRISTNSLFQSGTARINEAQGNLLKTQQQLSANRRILSPADDPVAAARALDVLQSRSINDSYTDNRVTVKNALNQEEDTLQSITTLLQNVKTQVVAAGNPTLDNGQRKYIASDLRAQFDQLFGMVNSRDGMGNFIFGGFQNQTQPFTESVTGMVQYVNDQGRTELQVGPARRLATSDSGDATFMRIPNKSYGTVAAPTNTGDLAVSPFTITSSAALTGHPYEVVMTDVANPAGAVYSVYDTSVDPGHAGTPVATGNFVSGTAIAFDGLSITLTGTAPAEGDAFSVEPNASQDVFTTIDRLIKALETPGTAAGSGQRLGRALASANTNFEGALDNVLAVRASVGSRLREIDSLDAAGEGRNVQYQAQLSELQDLDMVKAISDFTLQQTTLQASLKAYAQTGQLSLFNLL